MENTIIKNTGFIEYEAKIKLLVLSFSLRFESLTSDFLSKILNMDRESKSLGNTSEALSMDQKVSLMVDTNYFDKTDKRTIRLFQSIRNQCIHNNAAISFESCLSFLNGSEKKFIEAYQSKKVANKKAGGEKAAKEKADEEINN